MLRGFPPSLSRILACICLLPSLPALAGEQAGLPEPVEEISQKLRVHDFDRALELMNDLESRDHPKVQLIMALQYELGLGVGIDAEKALGHARRAAAQEDWEAAQYMAWRAVAGSEEDRDLKAAMEWREKMAQWQEANPTPRAIPETVMVPEAKSYRPVYKVATDWNHEKAKAKDPIAQYNMFVCLFEGRGTEMDPVRAMYWLMRSANAGYGEAAHWLSLCYSIGLIAPENPEMALKYLGIAAESGHAQSQYDLAMRLMRGRGVEADPDAAVAWLEKAVAAGHPEATSELAEIYYDGDIVPQDRSRAYALYEKAVGMGDNDSLYDLAWMVFYGQSVEENPEEGIRLFTEAADKGNRASALRLAKIYLNGWKVEKDPRLAKEWADKALSMGSDYAHYVLGMLHRDGLLGEVDYEEAFLHFEQAAREGDDESQIQMGYLLLWGKGIARDLEESYSWYQLAAEQGNEYAQKWLLFMEGLGWGTEQKPESLIAYLEREYDRSLSKEYKDRMLQFVTAKPDYEQTSVDVGPLLEEAGLAGKMPDEMSQEELELLKSLYRQAIEEQKNAPPPPEDTAEEAEVQKVLEESWQREVDKQILLAGPDKDFRPPKPYLRPPPPYPPIMRRFEFEDTVVVLLNIGTDGWVKHVKYEREPLPQFKEAVDYILPEWRFIPAIEDGKPVSTKVRIPIPFKFEKNPDPSEND